ncbi:hypothetical protein BCR35DRAFT_192229 [Leucosporidium creatinivorum]|uniref:F-box domain-containing protein n=1 Tax=Leucosporidium creatinivorum TaxID=106004 RepID=A0A1Y2FYI5_9BASI|nr:hypothetical protein BCR35DRAFT_192229 [Leucosporidium creatinivorum]
MEDQAVQQAPPTPYARPQQPADSPAASLPTETLTHILDLALQDLVPLERQTIRMVFSSVCKHWWTVASSERELVVQGSKQGFSGGYGTLGKGFRDSLASCDTLTELEMYGKIEMGGTSFAHIFTNLPKLRRIVTPSLRVTSWVYPFQPNSSPTKLQQLVMPFESSRGAVTELVKCAKASLRTLRTRIVYTAPPLVRELTPAAAYLVDVKLLGGADWTGHSHYLTPFINKPASQTHLQPLQGVKAPAAFQYIATAQQLKALTLTQEIQRGWTELEQVEVQLAAEKAGVEFKLR